MNKTDNKTRETERRTLAALLGLGHLWSHLQTAHFLSQCCFYSASTWPCGIGEKLREAEDEADYARKWQSKPEPLGDGKGPWRRATSAVEAISRNTASSKSVIRDAKRKLHLFHSWPDGATRCGRPWRRQYPQTNAIWDDFSGPCVAAC